MELPTSSKEVTTSIDRFDALTAAKKRSGRELSRSGGMKWLKDSPTRRPFVAEFAGARSASKARSLDAFTWRGSNEKNRREIKPRRKTLHDIKLRLVSLGAHVGSVCVIDGNLRENRS